jgi:hypothetical protein
MGVQHPSVDAASANVSQHTSAYVSIRQHTSAYVSIRQHTSAYVSIRQHTSAYDESCRTPGGLNGPAVPFNTDHCDPTCRKVKCCNCALCGQEGYVTGERWQNCLSLKNKSIRVGGVQSLREPEAVYKEL